MTKTEIIEKIAKEKGWKVVDIKLNKDEFIDVEREILKEAFDKVADPKDWRNPIGPIRVTADDLPVTIRAIEYFTATNPKIGFIESDEYSIWSEGYRNGPAGP